MSIVAAVAHTMRCAISTNAGATSFNASVMKRVVLVGEGCVDCDLRDARQGPADDAACLGGRGMFGERGLVDTRNVSDGDEFDLGDGGLPVHLSEM